MANLIVVCGPQAVGKMSVAEQIQEKIGYNLMINHDSIEISDKIFGISTPAQKEFNKIFRENAFNLSIKYDIDMIFTFVCAFDLKDDVDYLNGLEKLYTENGGNFYLVELKTDLETRKKRNVTPNRLAKKYSKNDVEKSMQDLISTAEKYRLNSNEDEFLCKNHLKVDNTNMSPEEVANYVIEYFSLESTNKEEREFRYKI